QRRRRRTQRASSPEEVDRRDSRASQEEETEAGGRVAVGQRLWAPLLPFQSCLLFLTVAGRVHT
ncbi:hypothetical protein CH063_12074, partial [Colletotrichum higginsianum]